MKKIILTILIVCSFSAIAQNKIDIIDRDLGNFPNVGAELFIFDENGELKSNLDHSQFVVKDNGVVVPTLSFECSDNNVIDPEQLIIAFDLGMKDDISRNHFETGKLLLEQIIDKINTDETSTAISSYDYLNYLISDFTDDKAVLNNSIAQLSNSNSSFLEAAFVDEPSGAFILDDTSASTSMILITDSKGNFDKDIIINGLTSRNIKLYCLYLGDDIPTRLKEIVEATGGVYKDNIIKSSDLELQANSVYKQLQGYEPCTLVWSGEITCTDAHFIQMSVPSLSTNTSFTYEFLGTEKPYIEADPKFLGFSSVDIGGTKKLDITLVARNSDIFIDEMTITDPRFAIIQGNNTQFTIPEDGFHNLRIEYTPSDSAIVFAKLVIKSNACEGEEIFITAGFPNTPPETKTIEVISPKCRETLIVGDTAIVEWLGLLPKDVVQLEYSTNNGATWDTLAINMTGLEYKWEVPDLPSDECLVKITQLWPNNVGRTLDLVHGNEVNSGFFNKDGSEVITASSDTTVVIWNSNTGERIHTMRGHKKEVNYANFSPNEKLAVSAGDDQLVIVWNTETGEMVAQLEGHEHRVMSANFSHDGNLIVSTDRRGKTKIWRVSNFTEAMTLNSDPNSVTEYAEFSPDDTRLVTCGYDGKVKIWDWANQKIEKTFNTLDTGDVIGYVVHATYNYDGTKIAASNIISEKVSVWDVNTEEMLYCVSHNNDTTSHVVINSSSFFYSNNLGELLLTSGVSDFTAKLWDGETGDPVFPFELKEHTNGIQTAVFNFDASRILTASWDSTAKIWNREQNFLQIDTTDCTFSIGYAIAHASDIDFENVIVNDYKDTIITRYLINDSKFAYTVESAEIIGANADEFQMINNDFASFVLDSADSAAIELRFNPKDLGLRTAELKIKIPGDSLIYDLSGIGIGKNLNAATNLIDFGTVELGDLQQLSMEIMVTNNSDSYISVDSIYIDGAYSQDFAIITGNDPAVLQPDGTLGASLRFTPEAIGRRNAQIVYIHDGPSSPTKINLLGTGVISRSDSLTLAVSNATGVPGDIVDIDIMIDSMTEEALEGYEGLQTQLRFNATVLAPVNVDAIDDRIIDNERIMTIDLPFDERNGNILKTLKFQIALGNDTLSMITPEFTIPKGNAKVAINEAAGRVDVAGICEDGGIRLFFAEGELLLQQNTPNPAMEQTEIVMEVIEKGYTKLFITDINGTIIDVIREGEIQPGSYEYTVNTSNYNNGVYFYILQTPTNRITRKMMIQK